MGEGEVRTKSGLMVGLGETHDEMVAAFGDLREAGVSILTVGQYLRPTERHLPVVRYWHPDEFVALEKAAYELGFEHIAAGPAGAVVVPRGRARAAGAPGRRAACCFGWVTASRTGFARFGWRDEARHVVG